MLRCRWEKKMSLGFSHWVLSNTVYIFCLLFKSQHFRIQHQELLFSKAAQLCLLQSFYRWHYHHLELQKPFLLKCFQCKLGGCHLWVWISTFHLTSNVPYFLAFYCYSKTIVVTVNLKRIWFEYYCTVAF